MVTPVPASRTDIPLAWAIDRPGVKVTPVPLAPAVPTAVTVTASWLEPESTSSVWPMMKVVVPVHAPPGLQGAPVLMTLMVVSPAMTGAARVVGGPAAVPTAVTLPDSRLVPVSMLIVSPGYRLVTLATRTLVAPGCAVATSVVLSAGGVILETLAGRGLATSGVVAAGIVVAVSVARPAGCHLRPVKPRAVQFPGTRRAS
jgi:hypothetical protein